MMLHVLLLMWMSAPDAMALNASQRAVYNKVIGEEFCSCDSTLTIAGCMQHKKACKTGSHLAHWIQKQASKNMGADEILAQLATHVTGPMCAKAVKLNIDGAPSIGSPKAPITLVEFADFRCTHCKHAAPEIKKVVDASQGQVRLIFMPFPLGDHPHSVKAAEAVLEGAAQGKFDAMLHALMQSPSLNLDRDALVKIARSAGLDIPKFIKAIDTSAHKDLRQRLKGEGVKAGIQATPSLFINGHPYAWGEHNIGLKERIDMEIERLKGVCQ